MFRLYCNLHANLTRKIFGPGGLYNVLLLLLLTRKQSVTQWQATRVPAVVVDTYIQVDDDKREQLKQNSFPPLKLGFRQRRHF